MFNKKFQLHISDLPDNIVKKHSPKSIFKMKMLLDKNNHKKTLMFFKPNKDKKLLSAIKNKEILNIHSLLSDETVCLSMFGDIEQIGEEIESVLRDLNDPSIPLSLKIKVVERPINDTKANLLHLVARYGNAEQLGLMLTALGNRAAEIAAIQTSKGWTALHFVAKYGNAEQLGLMLTVLGDRAADIAVVQT